MTNEAAAPTFTSHSPNSGRTGLIAILAAALFGVFILPWLVPLSEPASTQSYTYGFNNGVAILSVGAALAALFFRLLLRRPSRPIGRDMTRAIAGTFTFSTDGAFDGKLFRAVLLAILISGALLATIYALVPFDDYVEMGYFIPRIELMLLGRLPYYDFAFLYGPAMLYLPLAVYRASHGLLSIEQAYFVVLLFHWVLGFALLGYCIRMLFPEPSRVAAFWTFFLALVNGIFGLGYNYTVLRFALPIAALVYVFSAVSTSAGRPSSHARLTIAAFLGPFLTFEVSAEMGLALTLALVVYSAALLRTPARAYAYAGLAAVAGAGCALLPWSTRYLDALFSYGGGASLPILPGLGMILFLAAALFFLPRFAFLGVTVRKPFAAACLPFCVYCGVLIIPSCSRCDIGHVFDNGLALFLIAAAILSRYRDGRWLRLGLWGLFLVFVFLGSWCFLYHMGRHFREIVADRAYLRQHPPSPGPVEGGPFRFSKPYPPMEGLDPLLAYGTLATPLGCSDDIQRYLLLHGRYAGTFLRDDSPDVVTLSQVRRQIHDVCLLPAILVPKAAFSPPPDPAALAASERASDIRFLRNRSLAPLVTLTPRHPFFDPRRLVAAGIRNQFSIAGEFRDYWIMVRRFPKHG